MKGVVVKPMTTVNSRCWNPRAWGCWPSAAGRILGGALVFWKPEILDPIP